MRFERYIHKKKQHLAVLIDPDKYSSELLDLCKHAEPAFFLVGGSQLNRGDIIKTVGEIKAKTKKPVILFPGDETQLCKEADGLLVLSLLSGRNPEYLIGKQAKAALIIKKLSLSTFPVAYLLVGNNCASTTAKVTQTSPLVKINEIVNTSLAAEQLGFKAVYLEAGSGSSIGVNLNVIKKVSSVLTIPLIVGGGIRTSKNLKNIFKAGANVAVVGNALEENPKLILQLLKVFD